MHYRAFISYSHRDARWARWVQRRLEGYRIPSRLRGTEGEYGPLPDRLAPIFRDREDLASAGDLTPRIRAALADSEALIVICSPDAARSPWVEDEIREFKRSGRGDRIYCLMVDGEPGTGDARECFPRALRMQFDGAGETAGTQADPIAADVRPGKDGKALARLKLLSGLLGVELDVLRRREAARRHRRMLAVTSVAVAVMLLTSFLAVQAVIARRDAERRQKQAEALVDFMLGDLTDKLTQVSRLDIMESVNDHAMAYFQSLPTNDLTEQSLEQRATVLAKIGNVRSDQGHLPEAMQSYLAASRISGRLARAAPGQLPRQLAHAQILTYLGNTHWYQGELDAAEASFRTAQSVLQRARPLEPGNPELLYQLSTIDNNLGHVQERRGRFDDALAQYTAMRGAASALVGIAPDNREWVSQLGLAHNNLAKMALLHGDLPGAIREYRADLAIAERLAQRDPRDNDQAEKVAISRAALGRTLALAGDVDGGITQLRLSLAEVARLLRVDALNTSFIEDDGLYSLQLARWLRVSGDSPEAAAIASHGLGVFTRLTRQDPANAVWQRSLALAWLEQALQARGRGGDAQARVDLQSAAKILEPQLAQSPQDRDTLLPTLATRLQLADLSADPSQATQLRNSTLRAAQAQAARDDPRLKALQIEALLAWGRKQDAMVLLPSLWASGLRDPRFVALVRSHGISPPTPRLIAASNTPETP